MDLVLSSGFLAFARHTGVVAAIDAAGVDVDAICGTSSGALVGALYAAGHSPDAITRELSARRPFALMRPSLTPWRGVARLEALVAHLRTLLPARFDALERPLAVGVIVAAGTDRGAHRLITSGPLPEAVAASCAMPWVFRAIEIDGQRYADGGAADRLALGPWRRWRPGRRALAHQVARTAGRDLDGDLDGVLLVKTPRSGASFLSLGDFALQVEEARAIAAAALAGQPRPGGARAAN